MRQAVLELCEELGPPARTARLRTEDLHEADEAFCSTAAGGVMPVARIDDRILSNGAPGPATPKLKDL